MTGHATLSSSPLLNRLTRSFPLKEDSPTYLTAKRIKMHTLIHTYIYIHTIHSLHNTRTVYPSVRMWSTGLGLGLGQVASYLGSAGPPRRSLGQGLSAPCRPHHVAAAEEVRGRPGGLPRMSPLCLGLGAPLWRRWRWRTQPRP